MGTAPTTPTTRFLVLALALVWGGLWYGVATPSNRGKHAADVVSVIFFIAAQWSWGPAFDVLGAFPQVCGWRVCPSKLHVVTRRYTSLHVVHSPTNQPQPTTFCRRGTC